MAKEDSYQMTWLGLSGWIASIIILLVFHFCEKPAPIIQHKTEIHNYYDSVAKVLKVNIPTPFTYSVPVPANVDTAKILSLYFQKHVYPRFIEDSSLRVTLVDTVSENQLHSGLFRYQWLKPIKTVQSTTMTITSKEHLKFYVGAFAQINHNYLQGYGPEIYLTTNRDLVFKMNYDIKNNGFGFGAGIKLFSRHARDTSKIKP